jgi:tetratricopeptide (TPR) repeat protein
MSVKICYVSMAFGVKPDAEGRMVDHDRTYRELIMPAVQAAGLVCQRADDFVGSLIHKDIAKAVITADVMLADVSSGNSNVMYELGIRHGLRRDATVLLTSTHLPFNIAHIYALRYGVAFDGGPEPAQLGAVRAQLADVLRQKAERPVSDSPLYEYFPELRVELPADLQPPELRRRAYPAEAQLARTQGPDRKIAVAQAEQVTRSTKQVDPQAYLDLLRRYRDLSAWEDVVRLAGELPPEVAELPQVVQAVVLAQLQLGNTEAAIEGLRRRVSLTGGDPETRSLLGSLYKKRYFVEGSADDLDHAIDEYRLAFVGDPQNLYSGRNLAQLLHHKGGDAARDEIAMLLPMLRGLVDQHQGDPVADYWLFDSAVILAVIAADWPWAEALVDGMEPLHPEVWMLKSTRAELQGLQDGFSSHTERERLRTLIDRLQPALISTDEAEEADGAQL